MSVRAESRPSSVGTVPIRFVSETSCLKNRLSCTYVQTGLLYHTKNSPGHKLMKVKRSLNEINRCKTLVVSEYIHKTLQITLTAIRTYAPIIFLISPLAILCYGKIINLTFLMNKRRSLFIITLSNTSKKFR